MIPLTSEPKNPPKSQKSNTHVFKYSFDLLKPSKPNYPIPAKRSPNHQNLKTRNLNYNPKYPNFQLHLQKILRIAKISRLESKNHKSPSKFSQIFLNSNQTKAKTCIDPIRWKKINYYDLLSLLQPPSSIQIHRAIHERCIEPKRVRRRGSGHEHLARGAGSAFLKPVAYGHAILSRRNARGRGTGKYIIHTEVFAGCIIGARPALCMGTQRGEISRRAERRTAGPREAPETLSLARCQCPIGMRPNNRAGVTVSFQWTGNPVRIRPTIRSGPPLSPPRLGRTTASDSV